MAITVHLLASPLRALVDNRAELTLPFETDEPIGTFLERLFVQYPALRRETTDGGGTLLFEYQVWHADQMVRGDGFQRILRDGDVVAFLLPISGGGGVRPAPSAVTC